VSGVTDPASPYFKDGQWGWDGTVWRKLPLVWGISDGIGTQLFLANAVGGVDTLSSTAVPAGEVHVIETIGCTDLTNVPTYNLIQTVKDGIGLILADLVQSAANRYTYWNGRITLWPGDYIACTFYGAVAGDDLYVRFGGYKMLIAE